MIQNSSTANPIPTLRLGLLARLAILGAAFFGEKTFLSTFVDFDRAQAAGGLGAVIRVAQHWGFRFLVALMAAGTLFALVHNREKPNSAAQAASSMPIRARWVLTHFLLVTPLVPLSYLLYRDATVAIPFAVLVSLWTIFAAAAALAAFAAMAPLSIWTNAGRSLGIVWLYSICTALLGASAIQLIQRLWVPAADLTFGLVRRVLAPMLPNLQADTSLLILSTDRFAVLVSEECSGLEGMGLMITFCCAWLVYFRRDYIFPRALLLIPVGLVTIYTLNIVRIAALMLIGHNGFPGVAVYGFHSQAGWIAFNAAACGLVFVSRRNAWLNRQTVRSTATVETENPTAVYVMPLLAVLIAGTVSHALASDFERFYPLRMLAGAAVLIYHRKKLLTIDWQWSWRGPVVGLLIFVLWIVTARYVLPPAAVPSKLAVMSAAPRYLWIACRTTTAVLIVPLVEELAYRGFLMRRLISKDFESVAYRSVSWLALCVAAIAFGLPHGGMWLPATAAGIAYGLLLMRRERLGEAVVAHATSNLLIASYVLGWNQWQLW